jgi:polysaccharide export outer membrane protein
MLAILLIACSAAHAQGRDQKRDYQLLPSDLIRIQVFQEPDLDREVRVSQEGEIFLPLIGKIEVKGRTLRQVEELVRDLYDRDYLVNPQVNIIVIQYQPRMVNVMGAVNAPGALEFPPEQSITVIDAISRAGGFNRLADRKRVRLTRTYTGGRVENFVINADELMSGASSEPWVVLKDDVIFVPERVL